MRLLTPVLTTCLALAACQPPPAAVGRALPDRPFAADHVGAGATLVTLPEQGAFALTAGKPAVLAVSTNQTFSRAMLAVRPVPEVGAPAFALAGFTPRDPGFAPAPLGLADRRARAELARKAAEAPLRGLKPAPRYRLQQAAPLLPGDRQTFWVIASSDRRGAEDVSVTARAAYVGKTCDVFVDVKEGEALDARAIEMGRAFDDRIYPTDVALFGPPITEGLDADGRVSLLVTPVVGDYGTDGTLGYFTVGDLFAPEDTPQGTLDLHSNQRLMLYVSSDLVRGGGEADALGTLAHEFQHLINASRKLFGPADGQDTEDVWLDEGLAMAAMHANGWGLGPAAVVLTDHVEGFLQYPERFSLTNWSQSGGRGVGSSYGMAYLFVMYLQQRLGEGVLRELVDSKAVGLANVEAAAKRHDVTVDALWKDFGAAVLLDGAPADPKYGFEQLDLRGDGRKGPGLTPLPEGADGVSGSVLPYSVRYVFAPKGGGLLELGGTAAARSGGWIVTP